MCNRLFCKPEDHRLLCSGSFGAAGQTLTFQSLDVDKDLAELHRWVNLPYADGFWNMRGGFGMFQACYQCILTNPHAHSFVGRLDGVLSCQLDIYRVSADELGKHLDCTENEVGFHLIMAPMDRDKLPGKGLTRAFLALFFDWYFSFREGQIIWAEPDVNNQKSLRLLKLLAFEKVKTIDLSYKRADLFRLDRNTWLSTKTRSL